MEETYSIIRHSMSTNIRHTVQLSAIYQPAAFLSAIHMLLTDPIGLGEQRWSGFLGTMMCLSSKSATSLKFFAINRPFHKWKPEENVSARPRWRNWPRRWVSMSSSYVSLFFRVPFCCCQYFLDIQVRSAYTFPVKINTYQETNEGANWGVCVQLPSNEIILFKTLAAKYLWWMLPDEALKRPERIAVQIMNLGDFADVTAVLDAVGEDQAREFLLRAEAGQFSPRSWHYWYYRLGLAEPGGVPPMPTRKVC